MASKLESGSMDNLLLRMVAPMLHRVVAILFMAGLAHGRKAKEVEFKVGQGKEEHGVLPLAAGPACTPTVSCCPASQQGVLLHVAVCRPVCFKSSTEQACCIPPLFHALQRQKARRQQLRMHGLHGLPRLKSLHPFRRQGCPWSRSLASHAALDSTSSPTVPNERRCSCGAHISDIDKCAHGLELCTID